MRRARAAALAALGALALHAAPARADHALESLFQDDRYLIYSPTATVERTLRELQALGVQRIRITIRWASIAPDPLSRTRPVGFNASDPGAYPASVWAPYDRVLELAARLGIGVQFNVTDPGPLWAMRSGAPAAAADHWGPSAAEFSHFVRAAGRRYSGHYRHIPRVRDWSIWNEPNQPGWLAPQSWSFGGAPVPIAAWLYRAIIEAAYVGLRTSGHLPGPDTILIGELAPEGFDQLGYYTALTPMVFLRALYCVDRKYRPLRGVAAWVLGCPVRGPRRAFVRANPLLFDASGFSHHPYYFFHPPLYPASDPSFVPLANLSRLERGLDRSFAAWGVHRKIPIYLTEYGYKSNPPNPFIPVSLAQQAAYLNQAQFLAWRDPRVRTLNQFLLRDSPLDPGYPASDPRHFDPFETGLEFSGGGRKPAWAAYRMPIWIARARGRRMLVWAQLRPADRSLRSTASVQWRGRGAFRTIARVSTRNPDAYLTAWVTIPGAGELRVAWRTGRGALLASRAVPVS